MLATIPYLTLFQFSKIKQTLFLWLLDFLSSESKSFIKIRDQTLSYQGTNGEIQAVGSRGILRWVGLVFCSRMPAPRTESCGEPKNPWAAGTKEDEVPALLAAMHRTRDWAINMHVANSMYKWIWNTIFTVHIKTKITMYIFPIKIKLEKMALKLIKYHH